ncbi:MAG TPA: peptidase dimerization domain-containing protein, partial [Caproicibacter sp.]|nr:peptidase dimerization domain-containing protein [Caproicibacter sp.]
RFGNSTCNIGLLQGGVAGNVIAEEALAWIAVRVAAEVDKVKALAEETLLGVTPDLQIEFGTAYDPVPIDYDVEGR